MDTHNGLKNEMYGDIPAGFYADEIRNAGGNSAYMVGKENAYYYYRAQNIYFTAPISYIAAEQKAVKVAPFIASQPVSADHAIFMIKLTDGSLSM